MPANRSRVEAASSSALRRHLFALEAMCGGRPLDRLRKDVADAVEVGHRDTLLAGLDGRGRPLAVLKSKRKGKYRGATGPPTAPFGVLSRAILNFRTRWKRDGPTHWELVRFWTGPWWLICHITGAKRTTAKGNPWVLPQRDFSGISPATWSKLTVLKRAFIARRGRD